MVLGGGRVNLSFVEICPMLFFAVLFVHLFPSQNTCEKVCGAPTEVFEPFF